MWYMAVDPGFLLAIGWRSPSASRGVPIVYFYMVSSTWLRTPSSQPGEFLCIQLRSHIAQCNHTLIHSITIIIFLWLGASHRPCIHSGKGDCTKVWSPGGGAHWKSLRVCLPHVPLGDCKNKNGNQDRTQ